MQLAFPDRGKHAIASSYSGWFYLSLIVTFFLALPLLTLLFSLFAIDLDVWRHLSNTVLSEYISQSFVLLAGVSFFSLLFGVSSAWIVTQYDFFMRRSFEWLLLLPMAMPSYIIAYTYTGILDADGPVQEWIREFFKLEYGQYWFPEIRTLEGAVFVMSVVLYPYIYLLTRAAFQQQSSSLQEVSRTLGLSKLQTLCRVVLPLARPSIIVGWSLVMMETLADYGTVQYFGLSTFTTGIFRTWFGMGQQMAAAQLSLLLLTFVFLILYLEQNSRKQSRYYQSSQGNLAASRLQLNRLQTVIVLMVISLPVLLGFAFPVYFLIEWVQLSYQHVVDEDYIRIILNTVQLASISCLLAVTIAVFLAYSKRIYQRNSMNQLLRIAGLGYAIPGTVIAVGVLIPFSWIDKQINVFSESLFSIALGLLLSGSLFVLIFAYLVRFMSISLNSTVAAYETIRTSMDESARLQGINGFSLIRKIHLPLLKSSLLSAVLLVFVDVLKELPATLVLRPFNFNTLAVRAYEFANEERLIDASVPSLTIVLVGLIPVILLSRAMNKTVE